MIVGYARTSSLAQVAGLEAQVRDLQAAGCTKIFSEQVSSVAERQQLEAALDYVREGDQFVCSKMDRLARSVSDLLEIVARLEQKNVGLRILSVSGNQTLDTRSSTGRLVLSVLAAVSCVEREGMLERQREGIAKAKAAGKYKGRPPSIDRVKIRELLTRMGAADVAKTMGIARSTVYKLGFDA
jgi:DNA invertase Pin-like site-specific DNA recombinase